MSSRKDVRIISTFIFAAILLVAIAFLTINSSFAYSESNKNIEWSVYYGNAIDKGTGEGKFNVSINNIDLKVRLDKFGENYSVMVDAINSGSYNAVLDKFNTTDLSKILVGTSLSTGKSYYVSDYVELSINYVSNNKKNNIVKDNSVKVGDLLRYDTTNKISINVRLKDSKELNSDELNVLKTYGNVFNLDINISSLYQQK